MAQPTWLDSGRRFATDKHATFFFTTVDSKMKTAMRSLFTSLDPDFFFTVRGRTNLRWLWDGLRPTTWCRPLSSCASPARTKWKIPYGAVQVGGRGSRNRNRPPPNTLICLPTHISPPRFFYSWMQCLIIHSVVLDSWMKGIWRWSQVMVMHVWTWLTAPTQP